MLLVASTEVTRGQEPTKLVKAKDGSGKRQTVEIVADTVQFLGSRDGSAPGGQGGAEGGGQGGGFTPAADVPADTGDFAPAGGGGDDDIPF